MIDGWATIALRFVAYADLMLLAGLVVPLGLPLPAPAPRTIRRLAAIGIVIAVTHFGVTAMTMAGGNAGLLDRAILGYLAFDTAMGAATGLRIAALAAVALLPGHSRFLSWLALVALGSLAWQGHAGAAEPPSGLVHRANDVLHLVASSVWIGALVRLLGVARDSAVVPALLLRSMRRFSSIGTAIVLTLAVSGIVNLLLIADPLALLNPYGAMLAVKLMLFGAMLVLAAANRWYLAPRLDRATRDGDSRGTVAAIRNSLTIELALASAVLASVAILGTLDPAG